MKRIFICSPYRDDDPEVVEKNRQIARDICAYALSQGLAPFAPHLLYTQFTDEDDPDARGRGIAAGKAFMQSCAEVWVYHPCPGPAMTLTDGMEQEVRWALALGLRVHPFFLFVGEEGHFFTVDRAFTPSMPPGCSGVWTCRGGE